MAFNITNIVASGIIVGGIAVGTLAFTGSEGLNKIGDTAEEFKYKILNLNDSLTNWKNAFNTLKSDAEAKLAEAQKLLDAKNASVSSLNTQIASLEAEVAEGTGNTDILTQEIERLNVELQKANAEIEALETEVAGYETEVAGMGETIEEAPSTSLQGVTDSGATAPTTSETDTSASSSSEPIEVVAEEPAPTAFNINDYLTPTSQTYLTNAGITGVSNIEYKTMGNTSTKEIVITADSGWNYGSSGAYSFQDEFASTVRSELYTKFGVTSTTILIVDKAGNVMGGMDRSATAFRGSTITY